MPLEIYSKQISPFLDMKDTKKFIPDLPSGKKINLKCIIFRTV